MTELDFVQAISQSFEQVAAVVSQTIQQIMPVIQQIYAALEERYKEAGSPYGNTHDGLMRWLYDMGEINQKQQEVKRILLYHETLIDARKLGEETRARAMLTDTSSSNQ